jgi:outer membrane protein assembly factor BamB
LDAASGEVISVYDRTEGTHEILYLDGTLYLVSGNMDSEAYEQAQRIQSFSPPIQDKRILAVDAMTARVIWTKHDSDTYYMLPTTLCIDKTRLFFNSPNHLVCLDRKSGDVIWKKPRPVEHNRLGWSAPTLVVFKNVVLSAEGKHNAININAASAKRRGVSSSDNVGQSPLN